MIRRPLSLPLVPRQPLRLLLGAALGLAATAAGQQIPGQPQVPQGANTAPRTEYWPGYFGYPGMQDIDAGFRRPFSSYDVGISRFQGFPTFPTGLGTYGSYPTPPAGWNEPPRLGRGAVPPPLLPTPPDWPSWVKVKAPAAVPYAPDVAVLVRTSDRVWLRVPGEAAFVPLYFFDKMRPLPAGSEVQVRHAGEFQLLLHGGSRLTAFGSCDLRLVRLAEDGVVVEARNFTDLSVRCLEREHRFLLPDGSEAVAPAAAISDGPVDLRLLRADEPGWIDGRATIANSGLRPALLRTPFGEHQLEPGCRSTIFLTPPAAPLPRQLATEGVTTRQDGPVLFCEAQATGGTVTFSGARFRLPSGATLQLDPILGDLVPASSAAGAPPHDP